METEIKIVKKIPKKVPVLIDEETGLKRKKRVCGYARVSTDLLDQKNSYEAQLDEYDQRIKKNPEWEFVGLYSDEGITGTCLDKRDGFNQMIKDALDSKIDLILVKSISRFARNTVDCLKTVRELRAKHVEVWFDKESLSTFDKSNSDVMLTIYASFAQEESKSISENVTWGVRKRMEKGQRKMVTKTTLGYYTGSDGKVYVNEDEADDVRFIFELYLEGNGLRKICNILKEHNIKTGTGKAEWTVSDLIRFLKDEKYVGDFVMQKTCTPDYLTHKKVINNGLVDKYVVQNHHPAIVSREVFDAVQVLKKENAKFEGGMCFEPVNLLTGILYCSSCFRPMKYISIKPKYEVGRRILTCKAVNRKSDGFVECNIHETLNQDLADKAVKDVVSRFIKIEPAMISNIKEAYSMSIKEIHEKLTAKKKEYYDIENKMASLLALAQGDKDIDKYREEYIKCKNQLETINSKIESLNEEIAISAKSFLKLKTYEGYLKDNNITYSIVKSVVKIAFRLDDNSIIFVLSKCDLKPNLETFNKVKTLKPVYTSSIKNEKDKELIYSVVDFDGGDN